MALHDHETERAVLAILADGSALDIAGTRAALETSRLAPADMHLALHGQVLEAAHQLLREGLPVDPLAVAGRLPKAKLETITRLLMPEGAAIVASLPAHAERLKDLAIRRRACAAAEAIRAAASDLARPPAEVLSGGAREWASITQQGVAVRTGSEHVLELMDDLDRAQRGEKVFCIPSGVDLWDQVLGGVGAGELTFVGAQPGVGKSSLIATFLDNWSSRGLTCGLFSLEDLGRWLPRRLIARDAAVPLFVLAKRPLTNEQMQRVAEASERVHQRLQHVLIDERSMLTADAIVETARDLVLNRGVRVIVIDHLGKIDHQAHRHDRNDLAIELTLNKLTGLAKDYRVPVVICAHLKGRDAGARYKRPELTDFAQTAFIERDARAAVGLYLDEQNDEALNVAVLKQTEGSGDADFTLQRIRSAGLVKSRNGQVQGLSYEADEEQLLRERSWS